MEAVVPMQRCLLEQIANKSESMSISAPKLKLQWYDDVEHLRLFSIIKKTLTAFHNRTQTRKLKEVMERLKFA